MTSEDFCKFFGNTRLQLVISQMSNRHNLWYFVDQYVGPINIKTNKNI